jgi:serine phosphatase RsbU (regulator of sigma subunit)/anti-sigma regulatory factor (Ser/Thr protein kinase)
MGWFRKLRKGNTTADVGQGTAMASPAVQAGDAVGTDTRKTGVSITDPVTQVTTLEIDIPQDDPLLAYILSSPGVVEIEKLKLDSPSVQRLKEAGVKLAVPLVSQGELIGLLNLGPRLSEADYSSDDLRLLGNLATQAAPALRVAQLARQQQIEAAQRERMEQELRVARVIQQTLLPKEVPDLPGWKMAAYWQPARAVSGDFYDFIQLPDGRLAIIEADVTDKGVPAALVMATTRSVLRSIIERHTAPGEVLATANNLLCQDMPPKMFVTCLYALLDPLTGVVRFANAGHNLPYRRTSEGIQEMRARGMPLGLLPDMPYEENEVRLLPGENVVVYSDGLIEAHNTRGEMFGFPRLRELLDMPQCGEELISCLVDELSAFTGPGWEQEDDVTFVTLERLAQAEKVEAGGNSQQDLIAQFDIPSQPGNERRAMQLVEEAIADLGLSTARIERMKTAVAEATMNAMEHGNHYDPEREVRIRVLHTGEKLLIRVSDHGSGQHISAPTEPDLDAKLAGLQSPRGWGLFLIKNMVDEMNVQEDEKHHTIELVFNLSGGDE